MKRRDFLTHTAGFAGILAAKFSRADIPPCPPPLDGSTTICPDDNPPLDGAPSWFANAAEGDWFAIPASNVPLDVGVVPGTYAFSGAGVDQQRKEYVFTCGGGHTDGDDNGVYALQLNQETPAWIRLVESTVGTDQNDLGNVGNAAYADGNPRSIHGYNSSGMVVGDSIWLPAMLAQYESGKSGSQVYELNRAAITSPPVSAASAPWTFHGFGVPEGLSPGNLEFSAGAAYDPDTGLIWNCAAENVSGAYPFWSIDTANGDITQYPSYGQHWPASGNVLASGSSFIVDGYWILFSQSASSIYRLDLSDPTPSGFSTITESGSRPSLSAVGAVYHSVNRKAYVYNPTAHGATIYTLQVPADPATGIYTWSSISAPNVPEVAAYADGKYSHFNIVQDMGNGQGGLIINRHYSMPTYMYKLPSS